MFWKPHHNQLSSTSAKLRRGAGSVCLWFSFNEVFDEFKGDTCSVFSGQPDKGERVYIALGRRKFRNYITAAKGLMFYCMTNGYGCEHICYQPKSNITTRDPKRSKLSLNNLRYRLKRLR